MQEACRVENAFDCLAERMARSWGTRRLTHMDGKSRAIGLRWVFVMVLGGACPGLAEAAPQVVPGVVQTQATFDHIGVRWTIQGDDDLDSTMSVEFRLSGT